MLYAVRITALLFAALALVPAGAHLFSMASKLRLDGASYLAAQRAYDGWSLFAVVVIGALLSSLALTVMLYRSGQDYALAGFAFLCLVGTQAIFWTWTFPSNAATQNWTALPTGWEALRMQWELSHAASAVLNLTALVLLILASVKA